MSTFSKKPGLCDCGSPATLLDNTGWHCEPCREWVKYIQHQITLCIVAQRVEQYFEQRKEKRQNSYLKFRSENRKERLAYMREYNRTHK